MRSGAVIVFSLLACSTARSQSPRSATELAVQIDAHIDRKLREEKIPASPMANDGEFLRRVNLDLWGRIPSATEAAEFLGNTEADRRTSLIETLLGQARFGKHFARLWRERLASEDPVRSELKAALETWLAEGFNKGRGWNEMVAEILTAEGTTPGTAFVWNSVDDGQPRANKLAAAAAKRFLGTQLQCAECHDHPYAKWKQDDFWGLAVFFSRTAIVEKKQDKGPNRNHVIDKRDGPPKTRFGPPPLKMPMTGAIIIPDDAGPGKGKTVAATVIQKGKFASLKDEVSFRPKLSTWLVAAENPYFAKAAVNRMWAHFFGRGLVNPVDDLHDDNPATHPELLNALAKEFAASGFDSKHLIRAIALSKTYQRSHHPVAGNSNDTKWYSRAVVRTLDAEMTVDSLLFASGFNQVPRRMKVGAKVVSFPDRRQLLDMLTTRDVDGDPLEFTGGIPQVLLLLNGPLFNVPNPTVERTKAMSDSAAIVDSLYLAILSRRPANEERDRLVGYMNRRSDRLQGAAGVWWILVNSDEFLMIP